MRKRIPIPKHVALYPITKVGYTLERNLYRYLLRTLITKNLLPDQISFLNYGL